MAVTFVHNRIVVTPDDPSYEVGSNEWNENHKLTGGTDKHVLYDNAGVVGEAANFTIESGNPNVTAGNVYSYNNLNVLFGVANASGDNWFIGEAGNLTVTGNKNLAMGQNALQMLTSANDCVAIGTNSLALLQSGNANFGLGTSVLAANVSGASNIGIGNGALQGNLHNASIAIGHLALNVADNDGNLAIGNSAGINISTGAFNSCIGHSAGATLTSSFQSIVIGYSCDVSSASANGQLSIGNYIYGTGLTGTGSTISTGKIGIGIKAPSVQLDVNGSINVTAGNAYQYGGTNIAFAVGTTAFPNYFFGSTTGNFTLTGTGGNVAVGASIMSILTTGFANVGMGYGALSSVTTASNCFGLGYLSLSMLSDGIRCIGIGDQSLLASVHDSDCIGIGTLALGSQNAVGAVGGNQANIGIGTFAGYSNVTGTHNTLIGFQCGYSITASQNTFIGSSPNSFAQVTSGSQNISIGYDVAVPSASANGQLCIGNYIYGTGLTSTQSTISTGKIGIGVKAPNFNLDVAGSLGCSEAAAILHNSTTVTGGGTGNVPTLTAGPVTGNPTKWLPYDDNGTTRYIPAW